MHSFLLKASKDPLNLSSIVSPFQILVPVGINEFLSLSVLQLGIRHESCKQCPRYPAKYRNWLQTMKGIVTRKTGCDVPQQKAAPLP